VKTLCEASGTVGTVWSVLGGGRGSLLVMQGSALRSELYVRNLISECLRMLASDVTSLNRLSLWRSTIGPGFFGKREQFSADQTGGRAGCQQGLPIIPLRIQDIAPSEAS
jgi:hypothetical protein